MWVVIVPFVCIESIDVSNRVSWEVGVGMDRNGYEWTGIDRKWIVNGQWFMVGGCVCKTRKQDRFGINGTIELFGSIYIQ